MTIRRVHHPYKGFRYYKGKISLLGQAHVVTKQELPDPRSFVKIFIELLNNIGQLADPKKEVKEVILEDSIKIYDEKDFQPFNEPTVYQYVSSEILNNFIKKGKFQLGHITRYHDIENKKARDSFEGFSFLQIAYNSQQVYRPLFAGYNFAIFCTTTINQASTDKHKLMCENFGHKLIKINNIKSFAREVCKAIGAKRFLIQRVKYSSAKLFTCRNDNLDLDALSKSDLNDELFDFFYQTSIMPCLFIKPMDFSPEEEIRFVFEMDKDLKKPISLHNLGLLDFIKVVN